MGCHIIFFCLLPLTLATVARVQISHPFALEIDKCKDICSDSFFQLPVAAESQNICQRGCRFFNIIDTKDESNLNDTTKECHSSCSESYTDVTDKGSCIIGCDTMSKKKQSEVNKFLPYLQHYNLDDQEIESLEADILLDPLIRKQVQIGYDLQYKIPEAYIRTMPIDPNNIELIDANGRYKEYKNNVVCSSVYSFAAILSILLVIIGSVCKIFRTVELLNFRAEIAEEHMEKMMYKYINEEEKRILSANKDIKLKLVQIPGMAFVISMTKPKGAQGSETVAAIKG